MSEGVEDEELKEYREQLKQVEEELKKDPENSELLASKQTLLEIIALLDEADDGGADGADQSGLEPAAKRSKTESVTYAAGMECEALHPSEKKWYSAVVKVVLDDGSIIVDFGGLEPPVQVNADSIRPVGATGVPASRISAGYGDSRSSSKRERVTTTTSTPSSGGQDGKIPTEIPQYLKIKPTDSEKVKQSKQKRAKAIMKKIRYAKKDEENAARRAQWQSFAKKSGVAKHHSIFSSSTTTATAPRPSPASSAAADSREQFSAAALRKNIAGSESGTLE